MYGSQRLRTLAAARSENLEKKKKGAKFLSTFSPVYGDSSGCRPLNDAEYSSRQFILSYESTTVTFGHTINSLSYCLLQVIGAPGCVFDS